MPPCDLKKEYQTFVTIITPFAGYKMEAADFP
jgi:hypothetical protein